MLNFNFRMNVDAPTLTTIDGSGSDGGFVDNQCHLDDCTKCILAGEEKQRIKIFSTRTKVFRNSFQGVKRAFKKLNCSRVSGIIPHKAQKRQHLGYTQEIPSPSCRNGRILGAFTRQGKAFPIDGDEPKVVPLQTFFLSSSSDPEKDEHQIAKRNELTCSPNKMYSESISIENQGSSEVLLRSQCEFDEPSHHQERKDICCESGISTISRYPLLNHGPSCNTDDGDEQPISRSLDIVVVNSTASQMHHSSTFFYSSNEDMSSNRKNQKKVIDLKQTARNCAKLRLGVRSWKDAKCLIHMLRVMRDNDEYDDYPEHIIHFAPLLP